MEEWITVCLTVGSIGPAGPWRAGPTLFGFGESGGQGPAFSETPAPTRPGWSPCFIEVPGRLRGRPPPGCTAAARVRSLAHRSGPKAVARKLEA
mgnify:FL=1